MTCVWRPFAAALFLAVLSAAAFGEVPASGPAVPSSSPSTLPTLPTTATTSQPDTTQPATQPATTQPATTQATTVPATQAVAVTLPPPPIPLSEVAAQAENSVNVVRQIEGGLWADTLTDRVAGELPDLTSEVEAHLQENARLLAGGASLETLRNLEAAWIAQAETLGDWKRDLTKRANQLDQHLRKLTELEQVWWAPTLVYAKATPTPAEVLKRIETTLAAVTKTRVAVEQARGRVLGLQNRASEEDGRVGDALSAVRAARSAAFNRILIRDSAPIWEAVSKPSAGQALVEDSQQSLGAQVQALRAYAARRPATLFFHGLAMILLVPVILKARRRIATAVAEDPSLRRAAVVFDTPIATALLVALLGGAWIYPHAPPLFWAIVVAGALLPTIVILRRLLEPRLFPVLYALVVFYAADRIRAVLAPQPLLARGLFMVEMTAGAFFLLWLIRSGRLSDVVDAKFDALGRTVVNIAKLSGIVFIIGLAASTLGYVTLANQLGDATLGSAYLAVILYAATRIAEGLAMGALRVRPLSLLAMINRHRKLVWERLCRVVQWSAVLLWILVTLEMLSVRGIVLNWIEAGLNATLTVGAFSLSPGQLIAFALTVWGTFLLSRFIRFLLDEDVYPRFQLARGLPYAISTMLHYAILLVGFITAVGMLGYDMTKFTLLAGAFGVGLGFGLQNIFNNFISGLILLFERPVKVGDVIQIGDAVGTVRRIGIRASVVRTSSGAEIILPNARLIADPVTNWTLSTRGRGIELNLSTAPTADPRQVIAMWAKVVAVHPKVAEDPPPRAVLVALAADVLRFELRVWTSDYETWVQTRSDLAVAMNAALRDAGIVVK